MSEAKNESMRCCACGVERHVNEFATPDDCERCVLEARLRAAFCPKYALGQTLWTIHRVQREVRETCPVCTGEGRLAIAGEMFACPKCHSARVLLRWDKASWSVTGRGDVGCIDIRATSERFAESTRGEANPLIRYMLDSTGVGSGTLWNEECLWPSQEDAMAECARLNLSVKP